MHTETRQGGAYTHGIEDLSGLSGPAEARRLRVGEGDVYGQIGSPIRFQQVIVYLAANRLQFVERLAMDR